MRVTGQQPPPDRRLQPLDVLADRGLPEPKPLGRQREAPHLLDGDEAAQLRKIKHALSHFAITVISHRIS